MEWQNEAMTSQAWLTARLSMSDPKSFPTLEKLLGKKPKKERQSPEELLAGVRALKSMFGDRPDG